MFGIIGSQDPRKARIFSLSACSMLINVYSVPDYREDYEADYNNIVGTSSQYVLQGEIMICWFENYWFISKGKILVTEVSQKN